MNKLKLKVALSREVDVVECPNELRNLGKLGQKKFGVYQIAEGVYLLFDKITQENICVFTEYFELKGIEDEYYDFYLFNLENDNLMLIAFGTKNITEIDDVDYIASEEFKRLLHRTSDFVIIEALNGERKQMSLDVGEMFEDLEFDDSYKGYYIEEAEDGIHSVIAKSSGYNMEYSVQFDDYYELGVDIVDETFLIVDLEKSQRQAVIRIADLKCSPSFFDIDYYQDEYGNCIKEYVWIENEDGEVAIMRVSDFKMSKFYSSGESLTAEYAILEDENDDEIILRLSDFSEARFFPNFNSSGTIVI